MPREELPPDPKALEEWKKLPQNTPSRQAMPPMTGGAQASRAFLAVGAFFILLILLLQIARGG